MDDNNVITDNQKKYDEFVRNFAQAMAKMPLDNIALRKTSYQKRYTKEQIETLLQNPTANKSQIREVVEYLMSTSIQFNILCNYLPNMAVFNYSLYPNINKFGSKIADNGTVKPADKKRIRKEYVKVAEYLQKLNIKQEFKKALTYNCYFDTFYGYEVETDDSYFIKPLNPQYCRISGIDDGCYTIEFDFNYFSSREKLVLGDELGRVAYPSEFKKKYLKYKKSTKDRNLLQWQELDNGICTKFNESFTDYDIPPFLALFSDVSDIEDYKELNKAAAEADNYKLIALQVPLNDTTKPDDFRLSTGIIKTYLNLLEEQIPEGVGFFPTPMTPKEMTFNNDRSTTRNNVQEAIQTLFDDSGFSKLLFSGAENATALSYSVKADEQKLFGLYAQFQRIINRKLKKMFNNKWFIRILNMSEFSKKDAIDNLLKTTQASVPTKNKLAAAIGMTPLESLGAEFIENQILELHNTWMPPKSSYTQSSSDSSEEVGRPSLSDEEISESGEQTREVDGNANDKEGV